MFFCESSSFLQKCVCSYIDCICKKPLNSQCLWSQASQENMIGFVNLVVCFDLLGPKILNEGETTEKEGTKWNFNGGHLHARKSEDQVQLPPDLPDSSRRMLASISMLSILSVVWPQLTFSLLISELFIIKAIGTSFHFHCQLPTEA